MNLCNVTNCTMCGACSAVCPKNAISFQPTGTGFQVPVIDSDRCVECGKCEKACPTLTNHNSNKYCPKSYMAYCKDTEKIKYSASGGIFRALAEYIIIEKKGYVVGACYDPDLNAVLKMTNDLQEIQAFLGSKYVSSDTGNIYAQVKEVLQQEHYVFFTGLPCQVAGLLGYLEKPYEKLITADIICHGTASNELFHKYIAQKEQETQEKLLSICHTSKDVAKWNPMIQKEIRFCYENHTEYVDSHDDSYLHLFLQNLFYKESCYQCHFNRLPRISDFTLGDYFGIGTIRKVKEIHPEGVSLLLANNEKALKLLPDLDPYLYYQERPLFESGIFNQHIWKSSKPHPLHTDFMEDYKHMSYEELEAKYYSSPNTQSSNSIRAFIKKILGISGTCKLMYLIYEIKGIGRKYRKIIKDLPPLDK